MTLLTVYDGASTIGGNKIYLEEKGRGILLDFGMNFAKYGEYYQEFLKERSNRGIYDLINLDMIPKINLYRQDLIPADMDPKPWPKPSVEAVLISHAHLDHTGNVGLLRGDIPIIASTISVAILKAMRDTAPISLGSEISYYSVKTPLDDCGGLVLESKSRGSYTARDMYLCTEPTAELRDFASHRPGGDSKRGKAVEAGAVEHHSHLNLPFIIEPYPVDHSILGAVGYILRGDTTISYTGDYRLHGSGAENTRKFISAARDSSTLITEGTRVGRESDEEITEGDVLRNCQEAAEAEMGLVVADFSARNFERLQTFTEIADRTSRTLLVTPKDAYMLHALGCADGKCLMDTANISIYNELRNHKKDKWETEVVSKLWGDKYVSHTTIGQSPDKYLLCFSLFDLKHLLDIKPAGGSYIYSSSEAFSEEQTFDFQRLTQWLRYFNLKPVGYTMQGDKPQFIKGFHASGHLSQEDLIKVIDQIDPDKIIPVHTANKDWFKQKFEKTIPINDGETIKL
ncbi:MAG: MBL fold metallo-hydrolase RNA specificity domain-containing protein [Candidatus Bathyarchaeia archaeon]|jgi:ribonuclease J